jgi:hypothetical protein
MKKLFHFSSPVTRLLVPLFPIVASFLLLLLLLFLFLLIRYPFWPVQKSLARSLAPPLPRRLGGAAGEGRRRGQRRGKKNWTLAVSSLLFPRGLSRRAQSNLFDLSRLLLLLV